MKAFVSFFIFLSLIATPIGFSHAQSAPSATQILPTVLFTGQIISDTEIAEGTLTIQPNDLVVLRWKTSNIKSCMIKGPKKISIKDPVEGIAEVRGPQKGTVTYTLACKNTSGKNISKKLKIKTLHTTASRAMSLLVSSKKATNDTYVAQDITIDPNTTFDVKWTSKGYSNCDVDSTWGNVTDSTLNSYSPGWKAPNPGISVMIILTCEYTKDGKIQKDTRVIDVTTKGTSPLG